MDDRSQRSLRKRRAFRLLAKMDKGEILRFRQFLDSPVIHAKPDQKVIQFFDHCLALSSWKTNMSKEDFEAKTKLKLDNSDFDKLMSRLYKYLSQFVALLEFLGDRDQQGQFALKYYKRKGFEYEEIGKKVKETKRELDGAVQDDAYFRRMLELDLESAKRAVSRSQSSEERGFSRLHGHLDSYYCILKLRFLCASINEEEIYGTSVASVFRDSLLDWLDDEYVGMPTLSKVYYHAFHILKSMDVGYHTVGFETQLQAWKDHAKGANVEEFGELKGYMINHYLRQLNQGDLDAIPKMMRFYLEGLDEGWLLEEGKLSPEHFKNILVTYCRLGQVREARTFFEQYGEQLTDAQEGAAIAYNEAVLEAQEKKYTVVIPKLEALVEMKGPIKADQFYGLGMRCALIKAYFEYLSVADMDVWDDVEQKLLNLLHAFPAYVSRKKLPKIKEIRFENFRKEMHRLHAVAYNTPLAERNPKMKELLRDFRSSSNLPDKGWFIHMAEHFMGAA